MTTAIVTVEASVIQAPAPNLLQQTGGLVTQGGSTLTPGTSQLVSTLDDLTAILAASDALTSLIWSGGTVTGTTTAAHGWGNGDVIPIVISGAVPSAYDGTFQGTITGANTFTYPLAGNPGTSPASTPGTVALGAVAELQQMGNTYFAGQGVPGVYVVELGEGTATEGAAALTTFIAAEQGTAQQVYGYLVPREWDGNSAFLALIDDTTAVNALLYFWVTTTVANRAVYSGPGYKNVYAEVESPTKAATEFSLASAFGNAIKQNPSSTSKLQPLIYSPSFGTTAYPQRSNASIFTELALASVGWIGTGQQGGVSGNIIFQGLMSDGNSWNFWYSVDWAQIQMALALANEVINGSASTFNPLYYNQAGIDRLQNRIVQTARQGVTSGLGNGQVIATKLPIADFQANYNAGVYAGQIVINAEPFRVYTGENPSDYGIGKYAGLSCIWIPQLPFTSIFFNLQATTLITG